MFIAYGSAALKGGEVHGARPGSSLNNSTKAATWP
jgi:hypothetical protein